MNPSIDLQHLPKLPGIYQMFDANGVLIYVGKAQNLKKRISSYFQKNLKSIKTETLVRQIAKIDTIVTSSESEALLLENNLIKKFKPRYNILFRDDKSYPYIFISQHPEYPRIDFHRGPRKEKGSYYGPFPNSYAVRETLQLIEKLFLIRSCKDAVFSHRSRPCMQFEIKRCSAPCVKRVSITEYAEQIKLAKYFLEGKNEQLITSLINQMEAASQHLEYEKAAQIRDQVADIRELQQKQAVIGDAENVDVIALIKKYAVVVIQILFFRKGRLIGNKSFYPKMPYDASETELISEFLPQYYLSEHHEDDIPQEILINIPIEDEQWLSRALTQQAKHMVKISRPQRGDKKRWMDMAVKNAETDLLRRLKTNENYQQRFEALAQVFKLPQVPQKIDCFDVSHHMGEATVASCVVFDVHGPARQHYRRFNIQNVAAGDDYGALFQAVKRRYQKLIKQQSVLPDLTIIDGGKGQMSTVKAVFSELQLDIPILAIAKGITRKPGMETLFLNDINCIIDLDTDSQVLHILQQIRDEAHRFAITAQRKKRDSKRTTSILQSIPGIGVQRRRLLLNYFGGLDLLKNASVEQIAKVPGIHLSTAKRIYNYFHE